MDNYRMLAEHFGKNGKVRVVISGNQAKTDGETIYLPEDVPAEIQGVLLATLIHESYHIRLTDFASYKGLAQVPGAAHRAHVLNVLEDIRIDTISHADWPNASNLYWDLLAYYLKAHGASFDKNPWQVKVMRNLIVRGYARPAAFERYCHADAEVVAFETAHVAELGSILARTKAAPNTKALGPLVDELIALLFPLDPKAEQKRQDNINKIREQGGKAKAARDAQRAAQGEAKALHDEAVEDENEAHEAEREEVRERAQAKKAKDEGHDTQAKSHEAKADAAKAKADAAKARREAAQAKLDAKGKEFQAQKKAGDKAQAEVDAANNELQEAREANAQAEAEGLEGLPGVGIGFEKVKAGDLVVKEALPENVEEEVREFLRMREARKLNAPEGRIDPMKLPTFFNPETLFARDIEDTHYKTRIHFLVDISGSMNSGLSGDVTRVNKSQAATQAVLDIAHAVEAGVNCDGLDLEFGVFAFDTQAHEIKPFEKALDDKAIRKGLRPCGGTDPLEVLRNVEDKHRPDCIRTRQIVFMLTDGEFGDDAYEFLEKNTSGHIKWVFIGIGVEDRNPKAKDLFGRFNITRAGDLKKTLGRALVENMMEVA